MNTKLLQEALEMMSSATNRIIRFKMAHEAELDKETHEALWNAFLKVNDVFDDLYDVAKEIDYEEVMKAIPF